MSAKQRFAVIAAILLTLVILIGLAFFSLTDSDSYGGSFVNGRNAVYEKSTVDRMQNGNNGGKDNLYQA